MIYAFGDFRLDLDACELSRGGVPVALEPQVLAVLKLLVENRGRVVTRDQILQEVWGGRIVSDAALSSRIKSARQAIGDDGASQRLIRTHHGLGFRFVGEAQAIAPAAAPAGAADEAPRPEPARPSIAVLPFSCGRPDGPGAGVAEALPHDLIVELSRLRWLFVIARGSSFQFRGADVPAGRVRAALGVRYVLTGAVRVEAGRLEAQVELCDAAEGRVLWGDRYAGELGAVHEIRRAIAQAVVTAVELQIPVAEAQRALKSPQNLDAWSAYHLGLTEMYRFDRQGTARAAALFEQALAREPGFARAHAGLSFAHFEAAFLRFADDRAAAVTLARRSAERGLELDPLDPFCNLVMGRAAWLTGELERALPWLDRAVELNPNYAQAKYSSAWTRTLLGEAGEGRALADAAMRLSPLDPLLYGMFGVRALSHLVTGETAEAAAWGERAARAPRAHPLIELIAAVGLALGGDEARARAWAGSARARRPGLSGAEFMEAFPFRDGPARQRIGEALQRLGL